MDRVGSVTGGRARWARLQSFGLVLAAAAPLLTLAAALVWGLDVGDDAGFFGVTTAVGLLGAFLASREATWAKVVACVLALAMGVTLFWTAFGLFAPGSVFDFVPGLLLLPGALLSLVAGIGAIRARRRGDLVTAAGNGERKAMAIALGVVAVAVVGSSILTVTGRETVGDVDADLAVTYSDFEFDESSYTVAAGGVILVTNDDPFLHTFQIDALDIDVDLTPGSEKVVTIPADAAGEYVVYCEPHTSDPDDPADDDMAAVIEVA